MPRGLCAAKHSSHFTQRLSRQSGMSQRSPSSWPSSTRYEQAMFVYESWPRQSCKTHSVNPTTS
ncbi:MAG TPA: hypothetical protein VK730_02005 [Solirubrobacteraceae bacterium]|nr:hypothetical protein [Solirubrobacteraceae bacterium]